MFNCFQSCFNFAFKFDLRRYSLAPPPPALGPGTTGVPGDINGGGATPGRESWRMTHTSTGIRYGLADIARHVNLHVFNQPSFLASSGIL